MLKKGCSRTVFQYCDGNLTGINLPAEQIESLLADGAAFETSGCPDCNRPYYNERPGGVMYNYPRPLNQTEAEQALAESQLFAVKTINVARYCL
ncbi:hypothetical protein HA075_26170 [bacterium BFN5]|nr:hypothetical protein HA075_26170 [bacterium BFN5]